MQGARQGQHEEAIGMHTQHYDTVQARANNMRKLIDAYTSSLFPGAQHKLYTKFMLVCLKQSKHVSPGSSAQYTITSTQYNAFVY